MPKCRNITPIGQAIRLKLIERNMTQEELSAKIGCSTKYLWLIMSGERSGRKYLAALKKELGIDVESA